MLNNILGIAPIKFFFVIFAIFAWSRAFLTFRKKHINAKELIFWSIVWLFATIIVFIPGKTVILARFLGMGRGFDALVFIAIAALFYSVYRLYVRSNENEEIITDLIRKIALKKYFRKEYPKNNRKKS